MNIKVEGMTCDHCVRAVKNALSKVPGVVNVVEVNRERGEAIVEGQPDAADVIAAIKEEGYTASVNQ